MVKSRGRWKKLPAIKPGANPCLNCPDPTITLDPRHVIAVGFGSAYLECDGEILWDENVQGRDLEFDQMMTCAQAEELARRRPNHDWRIVLDGPMHGETYQRQRGKWVCVATNQGFA